MTLPWLPVIWVDILGSSAILLLAGLCVISSLRLLRTRPDRTFYNY
ncbi:MAG: sensor histidine kinase, partial [Deltaproteobacteria bacterium]|nr:sensor histidine kinase [Deltaproteobacteria bacterium]